MALALRRELVRFWFCPKPHQLGLASGARVAEVGVVMIIFP